jgi:hypothetical protein
MTSNEIRRGNVVAYKGKPATLFVVDKITATQATVIGIKDNSSHTYVAGNLAPVPITADLCRKLGFIERLPGLPEFYLPIDDRSEIAVNEDRAFYAFSANNFNFWADKPLMFLHEIQNVYFLLSGKELDAKTKLK